MPETELTDPTIVEFIAASMTELGKSPQVVARECGFENPAAIQMILDGVIKLPIDKIPALAKSLKTEGDFLLILAMSEYMPDFWEVYRNIMRDEVMGYGEHLVLHEYRKICKRGRNVKIFKIADKAILITHELVQR